MPSFLADTAALIARLTGQRELFADEDSLKRHVARGAAEPAARPSALMRRNFDVTLETHRGHEVYTIAPRFAVPRGHVVYLHGGAYVNAISRWHWSFIARMSRKLGMSFTVPLYPRAPRHDCETASDFLLSVWRDLAAAHDPSSVVVMGDSCGGGLSMSLAMQARAANLPPPAGLVLVSPWLDVTASHPMQAEVEKSDPLLMREGLAAAGRWYAGTLALDDPRVSPLHGDLADLPPTLMLCGTRDILIADARNFAARARAEGAPVTYHEEPGLMHVYPLLMFPESRRAQASIVHFVRERVAGPESAP